MNQTQQEQILDALKSGEVLNPIKVLNNYGCLRLGARIYDLRKEGWNIYSYRGVNEGWQSYKLGDPPRMNDVVDQEHGPMGLDLTQ